MSAAQHAPMDMRTAQAMLQYVDGCEDRATWVSIGMALKSEFGHDAYDAWEQWSSNAANFSAKACKASWRGFKSSVAGGYTIGTLVKLAKDGGYQAEPGAVANNAELAQRRAERMQRAARDQAERDALRASAQERAVAVWKAGQPRGTSAYAERKGIDAPESVRYGEAGELLIPMLRYDLDRARALKGIQTIHADGTKKFTYGMEKPGTACRLGLAVVGEPVFVCEGYATGMTIRMALGRRYPVFVAFDAYNLPVVAEFVHYVLPTCPMIICADDDWKTQVRGLPNNTGRIQAQVAMESVMDAGARLVVRTAPIFAQGAAREAKDTDFNDLARLEGLPEVAAQLQTALDAYMEIKRYG